MTDREPNLFPESPEERIQRVDAEILALLIGKPGGLYGETLDDDERAVLRTVRYRRGNGNAVTIREITEQTGLGARTVKGAVRNLRLNFRLPIASSKEGFGGGYFLWVNREEAEAFKNQVLDQVRAEIEVLRAITSEAEALDIIAQLRAGVTP